MKLMGQKNAAQIKMGGRACYILELTLVRQR